MIMITIRITNLKIYIYIEDDYVNENMNYETISEDEIIIGDEIENKNLENNTRKIGNIANSFRIN